MALLMLLGYLVCNVLMDTKMLIMNKTLQQIMWTLDAM